MDMPMEEGGHSHGHGMWLCNGEPRMGDGGSWIGHFFPGVVFFIWGLHWLQGTYCTYFSSLRHKGGDFRARTTYSLWRLPAYVESVCKALFPFIAISLELYFAHRGGYRNLICPADTVRAGRFDGLHIGNWQHAAMYPGFILSGIVDLVGYELELPPGTQQVFLFLGFLNQAVLMGLHKKHAPLDTMIHLLLFYAVLANAVAILLEAIFPRNFLVSCGRIGTTFLQAAWFWAATRMMFESRRAWDEMGGTDMAPSMMAPVFFSAIVCVISAGMLAVYVVFHMAYRIADVAPASHERTGLLDEENAERHVAMSTMPAVKHRDVHLGH